MKFNLATIGLLGCWVLSVQAESEWDFLAQLPAESEAGISLGTDSASGTNRLVYAALAAPANTRFDLALGDSLQTSDQAELNTSFFSAGLTSDPLAKFNLGVSYESWGNDDSLTIDSWRWSLGFNADYYSLNLRLHRRSIELLSARRSPNQTQQRVAVNSNGAGVALDYFGKAGWSFSAGFDLYDYSEDLTRLSADPHANVFFSPDTLRLASGLDDNRIRLSASYFFHDQPLGLEWQRSVSTVDDSRSTATSVFTSYELSSAWRLDLQGGWQNVDYNSDVIFFGNLGLGYRW